MSADRDGKVEKEQEGHFIIHVLHPAASVLLSPADEEVQRRLMEEQISCIHSVILLQLDIK